MGFREGNQLQKQGEGKEGQETQGHAGWKKKAQKTSLEAALANEAGMSVLPKPNQKEQIHRDKQIPMSGCRRSGVPTGSILMMMY